MCEYNGFTLLNIYFPNGGGEDHRLEYKLKFFGEFLNYIKKLQSQGHKVIFCGDVNVAHHEIDLARPKENEDNTGFLPIERAWIDKVISAGYSDAFRNLYPNLKDKYTYWDMKTFARDRNVGWRIDYFFVTSGILKLTKKCNILDTILGSDHCPIEIVIG